jgi:hypothetical protein
MYTVTAFKEHEGSCAVLPVVTNPEELSTTLQSLISQTTIHISNALISSNVYTSAVDYFQFTE